MKRWLLSLLLICVAPRVALAQAPTASDVDVTVAGEEQVVAALQLRLEVMLRSYPVAVHWVVASAIAPRDVLATKAPSTLAHVWLDARGSSRAVLYLVDTAHERFLVRVVPLEAGYDEVAYESIGTIVQSSVEALLAGASVGVSREAAEVEVKELEPPAREKAEPAAQRVEAAPKPARDATRPPVRPAPRNSFALELGYRAQLQSTAPTLLHGPELGFAFGRSDASGWAPRVHGVVGYRLPSEWTADRVGVRFEGAGGRVEVGAGSALNRSLGGRVAFSAGLDWFHVTPTVSGTSERVRGGFSLFEPNFGLLVALEGALSKHWAAWLVLAVERDLLGNHFDVVREGERVAALKPLPVLPVVRVGLRWCP